MSGSRLGEHCVTAQLFFWRICGSNVLCRDGEELTFVSERDGNLELYQQQLSKERRSEGGVAAEGREYASMQRRAAPKRLTYAVSMQARMLCNSVLISTFVQEASVCMRKRLSVLSSIYHA